MGFSPKARPPGQSNSAYPSGTRGPPHNPDTFGPYGPYSYLFCLLLLLLQMTMEAVMSIEDDEEDEAFLRSLIRPEEDRRRLHPELPWLGGYRWFRSANVIP